MALRRINAGSAFAVELVAVGIVFSGLHGCVEFAYGFYKIRDGQAQFFGEFFQGIGFRGGGIFVVVQVDVHLANLGVEYLDRDAAGLCQHFASHAGVRAAACVPRFVDKTLALEVDHDRIRIHVAMFAFRMHMC